MFKMAYDITIGNYRLQMLDSVVIKRSVENLMDTAIITVPGVMCNRTLNVEEKISRGDEVCILFGYDSDTNKLPEEFIGYVESIAVDDDNLIITCEDELFHFRKSLKNKVLVNVSVHDVLAHIIREIDKYDLSCDYDFVYDTFTIYHMTGYDVLKQIQEETHANIYLKGKTLHLHPQYSEVGKKIIYDFAVNIEKSDLIYKDPSNQQMLVRVNYTDEDGKAQEIEKGTPGGDLISFDTEGISDRASLENFAEEMWKAKSYEGYEGSITGWLIPYAEPTSLIEIRDEEYPYKNGIYYAVSVETTFSEKGGVRKITVGKKIE